MTTKSDILTLDISGTVFKTRISTLQTIPESRLAQLVITQKGRAEKSIFFDRDPRCFFAILNAYRDGELHTPKDICPQRFRKELDFWKIPLHLLAPCCWETYYKSEEDLSVTAVLLQRYQLRKCSRNKVENTDENLICQSPSIQKVLGKQETGKGNKPSKLWLFLDEPASSHAAKVWYLLYMVMVLTNIVTVLLWHNPDLRVDPYINPPFNQSYFKLNPYVKMIMKQRLSELAILFLYSDIHPALFITDLVCMTFFIIETVIHFSACPNKKRYLMDLFNMLKMVLCITMIGTLLLDLNRQIIKTELLGYVYIIIRSISVTRFLLIFRLRKLYKGLDILLLAVQNSFKELALLAFGLVVYVVIYGTMMFSAEALTDNFPNIWIAMWWALITMTTVGYGDYYPTTTTGYMVGTLCAVNGLIMLALPVAAIANNFSQLYSKQAEIEKHRREIKEQRLSQQSSSDNKEKTMIQTQTCLTNID